MTPHLNIYKFTWTSLDVKTHNQIDHILIHSSQQSSVLDPDHYLVVAKVRERLAVSKKATHRFHTERFNLKKFNTKRVKYSIVLKCEIGSQLWKI
jgi:hypothetical protein